MTETEKKAWELVEKAGAKLGQTVDTLGPAAARYVAADAWATVVTMIVLAVLAFLGARWVFRFEIKDSTDRGAIRFFTAIVTTAVIVITLSVAGNFIGRAFEPVGYLVMTAVQGATR